MLGLTSYVLVLSIFLIDLLYQGVPPAYDEALGETVEAFAIIAAAVSISSIILLGIMYCPYILL